jgi:hypothetical protein
MGRVRGIPDQQNVAIAPDWSAQSRNESAAVVGDQFVSMQRVRRTSAQRLSLRRRFRRSFHERS